MASTHRIASRFLAIGGRFVIDPAGGLNAALDAQRLVSAGIPESERRHRRRRARAAIRLIDRRGSQVAALINQHGKPVSGWSVWEGR